MIRAPGSGSVRPCSPHDPIIRQITQEESSKRRPGRAASILGASCALCKPLGARRAAWGHPVGPSWVEPNEGILALSMTEQELGDDAGERGHLLAAGKHLPQVLG